MRLNKYLARCGVGSRRECDDIIETGRVAVNGMPVFEPGEKVDPDEDEVTVDDEPVLPEESVYYRYHKPLGQATTLSDPHIEHTLESVVDEIPQRVYPVGRLDMDSRGLLVLTNDGQLKHRLSHPKFEVGKTYEVTLDEPPSNATLEIMRSKGVHLEGRRTVPADIQRLDDTLLEMTLIEGRNRQIRRMFDKFDYEVEDILRTSVGPIDLGDLEPGAYEVCTEEEVATMKEEVLDD
jgi:23S rRNA pseudouridine2605 synthase